MMTSFAASGPPSKVDDGVVKQLLVSIAIIDAVTSGLIAFSLVGWRLHGEVSQFAVVICLLSLLRAAMMLLVALSRRMAVLGACLTVASSAGAFGLIRTPRGTLEAVSVACACLFIVLDTCAIMWARVLTRRRHLVEAEHATLEAVLLEDGNHGDEDKAATHGWWRLIQLSRPEWCRMSVATVALILGLLSQLALPTLFGSMIDAIADDSHSHAHQRTELLSAFIELLVLLSASLVFTGIRSYIFNVSGEKVVARVRRKLFSAMLAQEIAWFDQSRTGDLMNRLSSDTTKLQSAATESVSMLLRSAASAILSLVLLCVTSWFLTLVTIAVVPMMIIVTAISARAIKKLSEQYQAALASAANVAQEVLSNVRIVRSFGADAFEVERYGKAVGDPHAPWSEEKNVSSSYAIGVKRAGVTAIFVTLMLAFGFASCIVVIYVGGMLVIRGEMSVGSLISFVMYLLNIAESMGILAGLMASVQDAIGASIVVFDIIDRKPRQYAVADDAIGCLALSGAKRAASCELVNVSFVYPSRPDVPVLRGVNLKVEAGMRAAIVGASGSGKSTIFNLIERFYDPDSGTVLLDGVDMLRLPLAVLRAHIALVSQEPALFSGSIKENIAYSRLSRGHQVEDLEVESVARAANVDSFVRMFPEKYDTLVGERGMKLSGGQKQRVAIARALYADPSLLLLDEATSALDAESEALVQSAIERLVKGRTSLTIAHRLSTVIDADLIAVIVEGSCVGSGLHADLLRNCPPYDSLVRKQLSNSNGKSATPPTTTTE